LVGLIVAVLMIVEFSVFGVQFLVSWVSGTWMWRGKL